MLFSDSLCRFVFIFSACFSASRFHIGFPNSSFLLLGQLLSSFECIHVLLNGFLLLLISIPSVGGEHSDKAFPQKSKGQVLTSLKNMTKKVVVLVQAANKFNGDIFLMDSRANPSDGSVIDSAIRVHFTIRSADTRQHEGDQGGLGVAADEQFEAGR